MGPFKCPECGVWWAGFEHRCLPTVTTAGHPMTIRIGDAGPLGSGSSAGTPWCAICQGWHIPGAGPCTRAYSVTDITASFTESISSTASRVWPGPGITVADGTQGMRRGD